MSDNNAALGKTVVHLMGLAARLEGEGQYNIAKLARATTDALLRRAAYKLDLPARLDVLPGELEQAIHNLDGLDVSAELVNALKHSRALLSDGQLPLIEDAPHPYVCRTCGHVLLERPQDKCPNCEAWPDTFQRFQPVYWLDDLQPFAALERLRHTPGHLAELIAGLPEEVLTKQPPDEGWSIREAVTHFFDAQELIHFRISLMVEQDNPILESASTYELATQEEGRPSTTQAILDAYKASRQQTVETLESIPLKDWWRSGQHKEFGAVTIRQQASYFAAHESTHLTQIHRIRQQVAT